MNNVSIIGRLTKDPELKHLKSDSSVCKFTIAHNRKFKVNGDSREEVSFFDCTAWGKQGEIISQYLSKGKRIGLTGRLSQRTWESQDGKKMSAVEIVVEDFTFIDAKESA